MKRSSHILVVDDNPANRQVAQGNLLAAGYSVTLAESGEEALRAFVARPPDLVLLDVLMPGGWDGFETCKRLRAAPGGADIAIIFVTALTDLGSHQHAMSSGADDFLTKPINRTELLLRVRSLLWINRLKGELQEGNELLRAKSDALVQVQEQREMLMSLVVHDLKSPLTAILVTAEMLTESCSGEDAESAQHIVSAAKSMHRMVLNLLDVSQSEDGMLTPRIAPVDLAALAWKIGAAQSLHADRPAVAVECPPLTIEADADLLGRLLENLIDNAKKYSPRTGAIRLSIVNIEDRWVEIRVLDQGPGIPIELREKIFEKYARLERDSDKHAETSRGLGLTFCRLASEAHGGRIWVDDGPTGGNCFHVSLPMHAKLPQTV